MKVKYSKDLTAKENASLRGVKLNSVYVYAMRNNFKFKRDIENMGRPIKPLWIDINCQRG